MTGALDGYRILDLTTSRAWLCGKILADLGADVIKVEPPGGDPGRLRGPFAGDEPDPERSLAWWFNNRGKRSAVVDLSTPDGREVLGTLIATSDALIESYDPGALDELGLGYTDAARLNRGLVYTSITPFGQDGPHARWRGPDLLIAASGGTMIQNGDPDRSPIRMSVPQYELHGAAEAAVWTVAALHHAARTGAGQHVDVSCQLAAIRTLMVAPAYPVLEDRDLDRRSGRVAASGLPLIYPCKDGYVTVQIAARFAGPELIGWAASHVEVPEWLAGFDWEGADFQEMARSEKGPEFWGAVREVLTAFLASKTKKELYEEALRRSFLIAPVNTIADVRADAQLAARDYFRPLDGITYAGPWAKMSGTPLVDTPRAPRTGEHTTEVLVTRPNRRATTLHEADPDADVFTGLKVLDMSWVGVGPMTSRYLADLGANVIRVESTKRVDVLRALPPYPRRVPGLNNSQFFADFNASKRGIGIDMSKSEGRDLARKLVAWADVVLESFTPGTMGGWQMTYQDLRALNPDLIMLSTCMQGQTGPHRTYRGFGQLIASLSGFYAINGYPDRPPLQAGAYTDTICQRFAATALIAAIDHRRRTGEGQHIDLSQFEAGLQFLGTQLLDYEVNGRVATRSGNASPDCCPHNAYPAADEDRWVVIACETDDDWRKLREIAGIRASEEHTTLAGRKADEARVDELVSAWTSTLPADRVVAILQPDVPAYKVLKLSELHTDPQVVHRSYFVQIDNHPTIGAAPYEASQAALSRTPGRVRKPGPCLGEDTWEILEAELGLDADQIGDLIAAEVVEITGGEG